MNLRFKYEFTIRFGSPSHTWSVVGGKGGLHLHITDYTQQRQAVGSDFSGGLECHWRTPPAGREGDAPDHDQCHLLHAPCWHDGTSLYVSERLIPFWLQDVHNHRRMFDLMEREYRERFCSEEPR